MSRRLEKFDNVSDSSSTSSGRSRKPSEDFAANPKYFPQKRRLEGSSAADRQSKRSRSSRGDASALSGVQDLANMDLESHKSLQDSSMDRGSHKSLQDSSAESHPKYEQTEGQRKETAKMRVAIEKAMLAMKEIDQTN